MIKNKILTEVFDEVMASPLGGEINSEACQTINEDTIKLHFWDGRRYELKVSKELDGCQYDAKTGRPIPSTVQPAKCFVSPSGAKYALRDPSKPVSLNNLIDPECRAMGCGECVDYNNLKILCQDFGMKFPETEEECMDYESPNGKVSLVR